MKYLKSLLFGALLLPALALAGGSDMDDDHKDDKGSEVTERDRQGSTDDRGDDTHDDDMDRDSTGAGGSSMDDDDDSGSEVIERDRQGSTDDRGDDSDE